MCVVCWLCGAGLAKRLRDGVGGQKGCGDPQAALEEEEVGSGRRLADRGGGKGFGVNAEPGQSGSSTRARVPQKEVCCKGGARANQLAETVLPLACMEIWCLQSSGLASMAPI